MDDRKKENIGYELADIITQKPHEIKVGRKLFRLYPVTLAKQFLLKRIMDGLSMNTSVLRKNPYMEALRLAETNRKVCCHILAIHATPNTCKDLHNSKAITERRNVFSKMTIEDIATLLIYVLTSDKTERMLHELGLDKEQKRMSEVMDIKRQNGKNNLTFGGLTIFGSFIGQLKELGYSDNEIIYEKGFTFLRLMLADKITSVYLTDEELQNVSTTAGGTLLDANDPASFEKLKSLSLRGVKFND